MRILIIEDDKEIAALLSVYLTKNGYEITCRYDGVAGLNELRGNISGYDMILLDMMLPGFSGDELLPKLRSLTDVPVIVISAVSNLDDRLSMMRAGADDYIIKPFELSEVLVRIEAVARRYGSGSGDTAGEKKKENTGMHELTYGNIHVNADSAEVFINGQEISLTAKEYELLMLFLGNKNKLFSKANLYESIWEGEYFPEDTTLKVHMSNLRGKLRKYDPFDYIETVWGMGYRLRKLTE